MENLDGKPNQLQVAYHLIYDNRTIVDGMNCVQRRQTPAVVDLTLRKASHDADDTVVDFVPRTPPREALLSTSPPMNMRDEV
jgi:hypothetical protein